MEFDPEAVGLSTGFVPVVGEFVPGGVRISVWFVSAFVGMEFDPEAVGLSTGFIVV